MRANGQAAYRRYSYAPRSYLLTAADFGQEENTTWRNPDDNEGDRDRWTAAHYQHLVSLHVNAALRERQRSPQQVASQMRMGRENLGRLLRGEGPLRLEDVAALQRILNLRLLPDGTQPRHRVLPTRNDRIPRT